MPRRGDGLSPRRRPRPGASRGQGACLHRAGLPGHPLPDGRLPGRRAGAPASPKARCPALITIRTPPPWPSRDCSSNSGASSASASSCCTTSTDAAPIEAVASRRPWSRTGFSSWKMPCRRSRSSGSARSGNSARRRWRWANSSPIPAKWMPLIENRLINFHPLPRQRHRRDHPGAEAGRAVRGVRNPHRLAWPAGCLAGRPRRQRTPRRQRAELRRPGAVRFHRCRARGLPRLSRGARRVRLSQRPSRPRHRCGRDRGGEISLLRRATAMDARAPSRWIGRVSIVFSCANWRTNLRN